MVLRQYLRRPGGTIFFSLGIAAPLFDEEPACDVTFVRFRDIEPITVPPVSIGLGTLVCCDGAHAKPNGRRAIGRRGEPFLTVINRPRRAGSLLVEHSLFGKTTEAAIHDQCAPHQVLLQISLSFSLFFNVPLYKTVSVYRVP